MLDVWSRRVVGWAIGEEMTSDLVLAALNMALQQRKPDGVIHHSDQGSQPKFNWSSQQLGLPSVAASLTGASLIRVLDRNGWNGRAQGYPTGLPVDKPTGPSTSTRRLVHRCEAPVG